MPRRGKFVFAISLVCLVSILILGIWRGRVSDREKLLDKEARLHQTLNNLRDAIDSYTYDRKRAPHSLQDLVKAGYIREVPNDPITNRADWKLETEDTLDALDQTQPGIDDVHSSSNLISTEGTAYSSW